ncbi:DUF2357 domain-containing protein [Myroides sp. BIT-d1]|uniref:DUF2357 domain-containing protein n=1 Tax=Myroides albus TaxID=2562892 RepID=A0A6I3LKI3_9FLAO|nr:DUF2357 domain-containing protein [Myroides albus]MTG98823.1 DUF2357 domain-containing protein [Myroides albus]
MDLLVMQKLNFEYKKIDILSIPILDGVVLEIVTDSSDKLYLLDTEEAMDYGVKPYLIAEGHYYEYELVGSTEYELVCSVKSIVRQSKRQSNRGRLEPNYYVGVLRLFVKHTASEVVVKEIDVEVLATKFDKDLDTSYRTNYRQMLEDITDVCTDLLMEVEAPVYQSYDVDYNSNAQSLYQRFCFVKSFIDSSEFEEALLQVFNNPSTKWDEENELQPISRVKRIGSKEIRQFTSSSQRIQLDNVHPLSRVIPSLPQKIYLGHKKESYDTPENRFVKFVLSVFVNFIEHCHRVFSKYNKSFAAEEALLLGKHIRQLASHSFFDTIQEAQSLKLNSPTLQKRAGYREVLNRWLQFELASQLTWEGGDDVYEGGKKNIAQLYEYWIFFQLKQLVCDKFGLEFNSSDLIKVDKDGLQVILKEGRALDIKGRSTVKSRNLCIRFSYNRSFRGGTDDMTKAGSWTTTLRPDYTLSIWPSVFKESEAEKEDAIVHIHFDAKYKIQDFQKDVVEVGTEEEVKEEERKGTFKNVDLLKMHAYKDAIRRTGGAYILYPGSNQKRFEGFHEILPGLGAFSICPSKENTGIKELAGFIDKVIEHLIDRTSQRERIVNNSYQILNEERTVYETKGVLPPYFDRNKVDIKGTKVLVGYCKSDKHLEWYLDKGLYNFRIGDAKGAVDLKFVIEAEYLLLREAGELQASKLFKIDRTRSYDYYSHQKIKGLGYPVNSRAKDYLMVAFDEVIDFNGLIFDYMAMSEYEKNSNPVGLPFVVTLEDLFKVRVLLEE